MRVTGTLFCLLVFPFLALTPERAFAQQNDVEIDAVLSFNQNDIESECYVFVEEDAPYSHFNGDCRIYRNHGQGVNYQEDLIGINPRQNFALGLFPRDNDYSSFWYALFWLQSGGGGVDPESVYCAKLGWEDGSGNLPVFFGHHSNSNLNLELDTASDCGMPPTPTACTIHMNLCSEGFPQTQATAFWQGQLMDHVTYDYQPLGYSSWYPIYDGNPSCAIYTTPSGPSIVRAIVINRLGQSSSCSVMITADICDGSFIF